jgi:hypothetical protein
MDHDKNRHTYILDTSRKSRSVRAFVQKYTRNKNAILKGTGFSPEEKRGRYFLPVP